MKSWTRLSNKGQALYLALFFQFATFLCFVGYLVWSLITDSMGFADFVLRLFALCFAWALLTPVWAYLQYFMGTDSSAAETDARS